MLGHLLSPAIALGGSLASGDKLRRMTDLLKVTGTGNRTRVYLNHFCASGRVILPVTSCGFSLGCTALAWAQHHRTDTIFPQVTLGRVWEALGRSFYY